MARITSYGICALCGYRTNKAGMTRHLRSCAPKHDKVRGKPLRLFHLRAEDRYPPHYWLDLETEETARLPDLDRFLPCIWLQCYGHLSLFKIGNTLYNLHYDKEEDGLEDDLGHFLEGLPSANRELLEELLARRSSRADTTLSAEVRAGISEGGEEPVDLEGIGDTAFWNWILSGNALQLHAFSGGDLYLIAGVSGFGDDALEAATTIVRQALERLLPNGN